MLLGWMTLGAGCQQLSPEARQQLADGARGYQMSRYSSAKATLSRFIEQYGDAPEVGEAYYLRGLCNLKLRQRSEAQRDFEAAIAKTSRMDVRSRAQASLAVMAYDDGHWARAVRYYQEALPWLEDLQDYDDQLLRYGISLQRTGKWTESARAFAQILQEKPNGSASKTARYMLGWTRSYFTVQCHALSKAQAANNEVVRLRALGLQADQQLDTRNGRALYLVHVGKYATYDEALQAVERIRRTARLPLAKVVP